MVWKTTASPRVGPPPARRPKMPPRRPDAVAPRMIVRRSTLHPRASRPGRVVRAVPGRRPGRFGRRRHSNSPPCKTVATAHGQVPWCGRTAAGPICRALAHLGHVHAGRLRCLTARHLVLPRSEPCLFARPVPILQRGSWAPRAPNKTGQAARDPRGGGEFAPRALTARIPVEARGSSSRAGRRGCAGSVHLAQEPDSAPPRGAEDGEGACGRSGRGCAHAARGRLGPGVLAAASSWSTWV